jgi:hypothetical protein
MELTEKFLASLGGWPVLKQARAIHAARHVTEATWEPPVLKGRITQGGKTFPAGLRIRNPIDIENLCPCRDSRSRGIICPHAIAVGLAIIAPPPPTPAATPKPATPAAPSTSDIPATTLSLEGSLRHLEATIIFSYPQPGTSNPAAEAAAIARLIDAGFEDQRGQAVLRGEDAIIRFLATALPRLRRDWTVDLGPRFTHVTDDIVTLQPHFTIRDKTDGWLDFHVHFTAGTSTLIPLADLQRLLRSGNPRIRLPDGRTALPDSHLLDDLEHVLRDCDPSQTRGTYSIQSHQRDYLETSIADWSGNPPPPPRNAPPDRLGRLRHRLRPYQVHGATWLLARALDRTGGLLADDMGLGKTIQTLAMIQATPGPHLVVCPSSLVWNWLREAHHFAPDLATLDLTGPQRSTRFSAIPDHHLAVTSYALLRRDLPHLAPHTFATITLDEAQHIKNPDTGNARAARSLQARARFILTGTPLENSIHDLWSLFAFILPGILGSRKDFTDRYARPIRDGDTTALPRLTRRTSPWILRRTKADLLPELPPKIEQTIEIPLTQDQKNAYTQLQIAARSQIDALRAPHSAAVRMRVLTALLRLRQASCDLRLLGIEDASHPSAKIPALLEILRTAMDGDHRTLVFSQFTSMLDLIAPALDEASIPHLRLDGSTTDRQAVIDRFQSDSSIPVLLLSLKAGGTGLNLTAADTVIHFDPWWNPAVEAQATDRAHRIGQQKTVTSIKLIAADTVEQRVLHLQQTKKTLLDGLLEDPGTNDTPLDPATLATLVS